MSQQKTACPLLHNKFSDQLNFLVAAPIAFALNSNLNNYHIAKTMAAI